MPVLTKGKEEESAKKEEEEEEGEEEESSSDDDDGEDEDEESSDSEEDDAGDAWCGPKKVKKGKHSQQKGKIDIRSLRKHLVHQKRMVRSETLSKYANCSCCRLPWPC